MEETPNQNTTQNISNSADETKSSKAGIAIIALAVLALCGIGFGVYEFIQNNDLQTKNNELQNTIKNYELSSSSEEKKVNTGTKAEEVSDNYLKIPEWGIKIKMPEVLTNISYKIHSPDAVWLYASERDYIGHLPDFANPEKSNGLATLIVRTKKDQEDCKTSCGVVVKDNGDNLIVYIMPNGTSKEDLGYYATLRLEETLTNPDNFSNL